MPYVASVGTYLPCWGTPLHRVAGDDEDAITMAVEAGNGNDSGRELHWKRPEIAWLPRARRRLGTPFTATMAAGAPFRRTSRGQCSALPGS